ncbi:hypothetical protein NDU88_000880 [Pleurodeles waltl]|uniref:Prolactin receptor n=1 Tax=Pleurodeles waltl TaxID=8319 RepID=A0AAV7RA03_PLEWA|nr:hypothetical protein NDU88_000880 [Pleurodeles waltl]
MPCLGHDSKGNPEQRPQPYKRHTARTVDVKNMLQNTAPPKDGSAPTVESKSLCSRMPLKHQSLKHKRETPSHKNCESHVREDPGCPDQNWTDRESGRKPDDSSPDKEEIFLISFTDDLKRNQTPNQSG